MIETKTVKFRFEDIQAAYNKAVRLGQMSLAREIEQIWRGALASQSVLEAEKSPRRRLQSDRARLSV